MIFILIVVGLVVGYVSEIILKNNRHFSGYDVFSVFLWIGTIKLSFDNHFDIILPIILILLSSILCIYAVFTAFKHKNIDMKILLSRFCKIQAAVSLITFISLVIMVIAHKYI